MCAGVPSPEQGIITLPLEGQGGRRGKGPQESLTRYKTLAAGTAGEESCTLLEIEPGTGRMHQIRRHLASIGCPLLGDDKYGDFALNKRLRKACGLKHLLLHAARLVIPPTAGLIPEGADIRAPEPDYFHLPGLPVHLISARELDNMPKDLVQEMARRRLEELAPAMSQEEPAQS